MKYFEIQDTTNTFLLEMNMLKRFHLSKSSMNLFQNQADVQVKAVVNIY